MLCDGHGRRRRDSPHAQTIRPTKGRLVRSPKRFEVGRRRTPEQILAEGFHCSFNSLRTLSDNVKCGDRLRMLCDGHGRRRRDSPHAQTIRPTKGRLVRSPKRFEVGRRRTPEQILAEGFHCRFNSLRTLSDNVKCGPSFGGSISASLRFCAILPRSTPS